MYTCPSRLGSYVLTRPQNMHLAPLRWWSSSPHLLLPHLDYFPAALTIFPYLRRQRSHTRRTSSSNPAIPPFCPGHSHLSVHTDCSLPGFISHLQDSWSTHCRSLPQLCLGKVHRLLRTIVSRPRGCRRIGTCGRDPGGRIIVDLWLHGWPFFWNSI